MSEDYASSEKTDLTNCDREPIHVPGSIQPHGALIVLQEPEMKILQVSANTGALLVSRRMSFSTKLGSNCWLPATSRSSKSKFCRSFWKRLPTICRCLEREKAVGSSRLSFIAFRNCFRWSWKKNLRAVIEMKGKSRSTPHSNLSSRIYKPRTR